MFYFILKSFSALLLDQIKGGDTSTAESGSEAEDIASPKAPTNCSSNPQLTTVLEEVHLNFLEGCYSVEEYSLLLKTMIWF